jgi:RecD/TraA family predicted helicase
MNKLEQLIELLKKSPFKHLVAAFETNPPDDDFYQNLYIKFPLRNLTWEQTDFIGKSFCPNHRVHGIILYYLHSMVCTFGDTLARVNTMYDNYKKRVERQPKLFVTCSKEDWYKALEELEQLKMVVIAEEKLRDNSTVKYAWHYTNYYSEEIISHTFSELSKTGLPELIDSSGFKGELTEKQYAVLESIKSNRVTIMDGLPGTGKTFTCEKIVKYLEACGIPIWLLAPTGRAAKNLSDRCKRPARTIHSFVLKRTEIHGDVAFLIDEFSMVDTKIFSRFLEKIFVTSNPILILVGDEGQLPSIGAGQVFKELIELHKKWNIAYHKLEEIIRQQSDSEIIQNAHNIRRGDTKLVDKNQFRFVQMDETEVSENIIKAAKKLKESNKDFIVLSPTHKGVCGVSYLNEQLREIFNPPEIGKIETEDGWRVGDRILINQNFYDLGLVNGDIGNIKAIHGEKEMTITIAEQDFRIGKDVIYTLKHAYVTTIHKAQGGEFDVVIMPFVKSFSIQLQRKLLYTAVTRAKKQVVIFGHREALVKAIESNKEDTRHTGLKILARLNENR